MRDSSACMKALAKKSKLSRKLHLRTKRHVDRQTGCEVVVIFAYLMTVSRHLGFLKFEGCTIRSDVPENPTSNIMSLCCIQPELCYMAAVRDLVHPSHRPWCQSKPICNFLLVINSNFGRISYRFRGIDA